MTKRSSTPADAVLVAIDMSEHRQEVLIERPEGGRRRRMTVALNAIQRASDAMTSVWIQSAASSEKLRNCQRGSPNLIRSEITLWSGY